MELNDFFNNFADEQSCRTFFKQQRESKGMYAGNAVQFVIIGLRRKPVGDAKIVSSLWVLNPVQSWRIQI